MLARMSFWLSVISLVVVPPVADNTTIEYVLADTPELHDWNADGIVSIVGDVPPFVECAYFGNCPNDVDTIAVGDCNGDDILSIVGDVPCFVNCVYFGNCPPSRPTGVTAVSGNGSITVSWSMVAGATSYNLYWNTTGGVTTSDSKVSNVTPPYLHTGLTYGVEYYYAVTSQNSVGESTPSSEVSATTQLSPPNILGTYTTGPVTVNSSNCGTFTFDTGTLIIDVQDGTSFSGRASFRSTIDDSQIEAIDELTGTVSVNGAVNGTFIDAYYVDGAIESGGDGSFSGQIDGSGLSLQISGRDTYGDVCIYTMNVTFSLIPQPWVTKAPLPEGRYELASSTVNGKIYTLGGRTGIGDYSVASSVVEEYDPVTDTWTVKASMPTARRGLCASAVNGKIYTFGGLTGEGTSSSNITDAFEVYDPATDAWTIRNPMPNNTAFAASGVLNGKIYIVGGWWYPGTNVLEYDPVTDRWETKSPMPTGRDYLMCGVLDGKIYAIGGRLRWTSNEVTTVEEYDPATDTWTTKAPMIKAHEFGSGGVVNGKFYAVGGAIVTGGNYTSNYVEEYDPVTDTWSGKWPMPTGRYSLTVSVIGNQLFAIGGAPDLTVTEAYTPSLDAQ